MQVLLRWTVYVPAVAIGGVLWGVNVSQEQANLVADFIRSDEGRLIVAIPAALLLVMPLALILRWWQIARRSREISYTTESGKVSVNLIAVEEALTRVVEAEPEVRKAHVRVYEDRVRRGVVIEAAATLWEVPNVTERNRALQRLMRRRFAELMPEQQSVQVNLTVHRLQVRPPPAPVKETPAKVAVKPAARTDTVSPVPGAIEPARRRDDTDNQMSPFDPADDLYVGPSYPVMPDDEDGGTATYHAKPGQKR
jgi:hypothetical protein